jgi:hypothetical protein
MDRPDPFTRAEFAQFLFARVHTIKKRSNLKVCRIS